MNKNREYADEELIKLIRQSNERAFRGRKERLRLLLSKEDKRRFPAEALAKEYYEEARLCWYIGAFVATILMSHLTLEETLRSHYRRAKGVGGRLSKHKKVDEATFNELIDQALGGGFISSNQARALHKLRRLRNPYQHTQDMRKTGRSLQELRRDRDFFVQTKKISAPALLGVSAENEARQAISIGASLFPAISRQVWGFK